MDKIYFLFHKDGDRDNWKMMEDTIANKQLQQFDKIWNFNIMHTKYPCEY